MENGKSQTATVPGQTKLMPRAIELGFPILEINRLAEPERNSFMPIYSRLAGVARK